MNQDPSRREVQIERKCFHFELRENPRGKFLRITEEVGGRYDSIVVPISGVERFADALDAAIGEAELAKRVGAGADSAGR
jgi:hypothetical protein